MTEPTKAKKPAAKKPAAKKAAATKPVAAKKKIVVDAPTVAAAKPAKAPAFTVALPLLPKFDVPMPNLDPLGLTKVDLSTLSHMALPKVDLPKFDLSRFELPKVDLPKVNVAGMHLPKVDEVVERASHAVDDARRNVTSTVTMLRELVGR